MSAEFVLRTLLEFSAIVLLIVGYIYEEKVIAFEQTCKRIVVGNIKRYMRLKTQNENSQLRKNEVKLTVHKGGKFDPTKPFNVA